MRTRERRHAREAAVGPADVGLDIVSQAWIPAPRAEQVPVLRPTVFTDAAGGIWKQSEYDSGLVWPFGGTDPLPKADVVAQHGPLLALVAMPEVRAVLHSAPLPPPEPLGMIGFEGKHVECTRRTSEGPWCEWRQSTHRMSLLALIGLAMEHIREVHGG